MNEWFYQQPTIDYRLLAEAISFYEQRGYSYLETPWIVDHMYVNATKPENTRDFFALDGYLVASGEQSLLHAILSGEIHPGGKYQTVTPCFRDDPIDELHQTWFMKLELMHYSPARAVENASVISVLEDADAFMSRYIKTQRTSLWDFEQNPQSEHGAFTCDIESTEGIELGSYGYRSWRGERWIYGTGLALPRFSLAQSKQLVAP